MIFDWQPPRRRGLVHLSRSIAIIEALEPRELLALVVANVQAVEGVPKTGVLVATFNPGDIPGSAPTDFMATINWGDSGPTTDGSVSLTGGVYSVQGNYTYRTAPSPGSPYAITVTVVGTTGSPVSATGLASVSTAALTSTGLSISPTKGVPFAGVVANFTDADTLLTTSDFTATILWGDGTTSAGLISTASPGAPGSFDVQGQVPHIYTAPGLYNVVTTISHAGQSTVALTTASVASVTPIIAPTGQIVTATANQPIDPMTVLGTFTYNSQQPSPDFSAVITWGDGQTTLGTVSPIPGSSPRAYNILGGKTYSAPGNYMINIAVQDQFGDSGTIMSTAVVLGPILTVRSGTTIAVTPGLPFTGTTLGTFTDSNPLANGTNITAEIDWGDGRSSNGTIVGPDANGLYTVTGGHTYTGGPGPFAITVHIIDPSGLTGTIFSQAAVSNTTPAAAGTTFAVTPGTAFNGPVATFIDTNPNVGLTKPLAVIEWGDGHSSNGVVTGPDANGVFTISGTNTYQPVNGPEPASYSVSVLITDVNTNGTPVLAKSTALVSLPAINVVVPDFTFMPGVQFTKNVATFTDSNALATSSNTSALIHWGDGSISDGTISGPDANNVFTVSGTYTYQTAPTGSTYPVMVTITDPTGTSATAMGKANVTLPKLTAKPVNLTATPGISFTTAVATFTDTNPEPGATALISWGDGFSTPGTVTGPNAFGVYTVTGTYQYFNPSPAANGLYHMSVTITDTGGLSATVHPVAYVPAPILPAATFTGGLSTGGSDTNTNRPTFSGTANPFALVRLFARTAGVDANPAIGQTIAGANGAWSLTVGPLAQGVYTITAVVTPAGSFPSAPFNVGAGGQLIIDTTAPEVVGVSWSAGHGQVYVFYRDDLSGMSISTLTNASAYTLIGPRSLAIHPASVTLLPSAGLPTDTQGVVLNVPGSSRLRRRLHYVRIAAADITDNAGNTLASDFRGPIAAAAYGRAGSNFVAALNVRTGR